MVGAVFIEQRGAASCYAWGAGGHRVRSPTGVVLQGTSALFSSHGVLGSCSSMWEKREREREEKCISKRHCFIFILIVGYSKIGYNNFNKLVIKAKMHAKTCFFFEVFFVV